MAEAHAAVAFSFSVTHEGVRVNYDREVLHLIWISGVRAWKRRLNRVIVSAFSGSTFKFILVLVISDFIEDLLPLRAIAVKSTYI